LRPTKERFRSVPLNRNRQQIVEFTAENRYYLNCALHQPRLFGRAILRFMHEDAAQPRASSAQVRRTINQP